MLSAQKQANHGSPYVLKEADIDSYLQDMESRDRRKGTLDNYHRCLEDFLAWLPEGKRSSGRGSMHIRSILQSAIRQAPST